MRTEIADAINTLSDFLGTRDIADLTQDSMIQKFGTPKADLMVLFGGSILAGGDILAEAIQNQVATRYIIVGGAGHTTQTLRDYVHREIPAIETAGKTEAEIFNTYLSFQYGVTADYLECRSTNCGNNITFLLDLIDQHQLKHEHVILSQDASMQRRMYAGMKKHRPSVNVINYAAYQVHVSVEHGELIFDHDVHGMWDMERYITLLLGEIPRLRDDENGYGPNGKGYIAHMEIPEKVEEAFDLLSKEYAGLVREANPAYRAPGASHA